MGSSRLSNVGDGETVLDGDKDGKALGVSSSATSSAIQEIPRQRLHGADTCMYSFRPIPPSQYLGLNHQTCLKRNI